MGIVENCKKKKNISFKQTSSLKSFEEKSSTKESVFADLVGARIEPVFIPENTRTLRNGKTFLTKPEIITKYYFKTFDHFSNPF